MSGHPRRDHSRAGPVDPPLTADVRQRRAGRSVLSGDHRARDRRRQRVARDPADRHLHRVRATAGRRRHRAGTGHHVVARVVTALRGACYPSRRCWKAATTGWTTRPRRPAAGRSRRPQTAGRRRSGQVVVDADDRADNRDRRRPAQVPAPIEEIAAGRAGPDDRPDRSATVSSPSTSRATGDRCSDPMSTCAEPSAGSPRLPGSADLRERAGRQRDPTARRRARHALKPFRTTESGTGCCVTSTHRPHGDSRCAPPSRHLLLLRGHDSRAAVASTRRYSSTPTPRCRCARPIPGLGHAIELRAYRSAAVLHLDWWYDTRRVSSGNGGSARASSSRIALSELIQEAIAAEQDEHDEGEMVGAPKPAPGGPVGLDVG